MTRTARIDIKLTEDSRTLRTLELFNIKVETENEWHPEWTEKENLEYELTRHILGDPGNDDDNTSIDECTESTPEHLVYLTPLYRNPHTQNKFALRIEVIWLD